MPDNEKNITPQPDGTPEQTQCQGYRTLPTEPDYTKNATIYKMKNGYGEHTVIDIPAALFGNIPINATDTQEVTIQGTKFTGLVEIDNRQQFLTACFIGGTNAEDKAASETIAAYIGDILDRISGQALRKEPIDYKYTSEIVAEAIAAARANGVNSPYIDKLEAMQPAPTAQHPDLFPDLPPAEKQPGKTDIVTAAQAQIIAADIKERYPAPPYNKPESIKLPIANLARNFHTADMTASPDGLFEYPVDKRPHSHFVFMNLLDRIAKDFPIAPIDKPILIGLGNLYAIRKAEGKLGEHGGTLITAADVIRIYRGYDGADKIDINEIQAVQERIEKLRNLNVAFDFSQHFQYNKVGNEVQLSIPDTKRIPIPETEAKHQPANLIKRDNGLTVVRFSYKGHMIDARVIEVEYSNGATIKAYELLTTPIIYEYADKIRQMATIETKLLDLRKKANSTRDSDVIKVYLLEQINAMRNAKSNRSNRILLDTLFANLRIEITSRKIKKTKSDLIKKILTHFRDTPLKNGKPFIAGFSEVIGQHRAVIGYDIQINKPDKVNSDATTEK